MAAPKFFSEDLTIPVYTMTEAENASYPLSNLKSYFAADQWRSSTAAVQQLRMDMGSSISISFCVIENCNFATLIAGGGTVLLQTALDAAYTSNVTTIVGVLTGGAGATVYEFNAVSARYWRILFAGPPPSAPQLGQIFLGSTFAFDFPYEFPYKSNNPEYTTSEATALDGRLRMAQVYAGRDRFEFTMKLQSDTVLANWRTFFATARGKLRPFYFKDVDGTIYYCHLDVDQDPSQTVFVGQNTWMKIPMKTQLVS